MTRQVLNDLTDDELTREFAKASREMGLAVLDSETSRANQIFDRMEAIETIFRGRGVKARMKLAPLLDHQGRFVRFYAAEYLLGLVPDRARPIIEWNALHWFDAIAADARGLLRAFDSGEYQPD